MKISIVGTGYVGLVSGVCLAAKGHDVTCVDVDASKVERINGGDPPIYEIGLEELLKKHVGKNLRASTDLFQAVMDTELSLIAVGTPFDGEEIDLKYIRGVAREIGKVLKSKEDYHVVVVKSTVVPGTTDSVVLPLLEEESGKPAGEAFGVGMNPEFLKEGEAVEDFMNPDRIVIGGIDAKTLDVMAKIYEPFAGVDVLRTDPRTAEMIKYTANSLLATLISFSNEIGNLCAEAGVDVVEALHGVHLDKRFSPFLPAGERVRPPFLTYLAAGCGFGGSCFPKDVKALVAHGGKAGVPMELLNSVIAVNERQPEKMIELLKRHLPDLAGRNVAVLGVAFKPGTDDIRESPALPVIKKLLSEDVKVKTYDPIARHEAEKVFGDSIDYVDQVSKAVSGSDAVLIMTRWDEFRDLPNLLDELGEQPVVVDGRRMLDKKSVARYEGIGL